MTIEDYRVQLGWSRRKLCKEADIDMSTLSRAMDGKPIYKATAGKIAAALSRELVHQGQSPIRFTDLDGLVFADD